MALQDCIGRVRVKTQQREHLPSEKAHGNSGRAF